jgi:hypothetical protein
MLAVEFVYCNTLFDNSIYLLEIECENCFKIFLKGEWKHPYISYLDTNHVICGNDVDPM